MNAIHIDIHRDCIELNMGAAGKIFQQYTKQMPCFSSIADARLA